MPHASAARIAANKANAQTSTGPRTPEGKAAVANNAMKHGLRSERNPLDLASDSALPFEREAFEQSLALFTGEFAPTTPYELRLVERLAQIDLRLQRAIRMETTHLDMQIRLMAKSMAGALPTGENAEQTQQAWLTTLAFLKNPSATTLIAQYESRLSRDYSRTISELRASQKLRNQTQPRTAANSRIQTQNAAPEESREQTQPTQTVDTPPNTASNGGDDCPNPHDISEPPPSPSIENPRDQAQPTINVDAIAPTPTAPPQSTPSHPQPER